MIEPTFPQEKAIKIYTALLTQSGESAPEATILQNSIGTIVWTRQSAGLYRGTLSDTFTQNKTWACISQSKDSSATTVAVLIGDDDYISVFIDDGIGGDDYLDNTPIEIRIYQ